jgi:hypothetical protein
LLQAVKGFPTIAEGISSIAAAQVFLVASRDTSASKAIELTVIAAREQ